MTVGKNNLALDNLRNVTIQLGKSKDWLNRSLVKCQNINVSLDHDLQDSQYDDLEALMSRYSRLTDILVNKMFRAIDRMELENPGGSLIDVANRMLKRDLIDSIEELQILKDLRNSIAHDYSEEDLLSLFKAILELCPTLIELTNRSIAYVDKKYLLNK